MGRYQVEDVTVASRRDPKVARPLEPNAADYPDFLVVRLSSSTNLEQVEQTDSVYVKADTCPFRDQHRVGSFGPFWRGAELDGSTTEPATGERRKTNARVRPEPVSGRYEYTVLIISSRPTKDKAPGVVDAGKGYDLRDMGSDLCLRLDAVGSHMPSKSKVIRVPATAITAAYRAYAVDPTRPAR